MLVCQFLKFYVICCLDHITVLIIVGDGMYCCVYAGEFKSAALSLSLHGVSYYHVPPVMQVSVLGGKRVIHVKQA